MKRWVSGEIVMFVKKSPDNILRTLYLNARSGIQSVVHTILEQEVLYLLYKDVFGETMDDNIAKFLDTDSAANRTLEKLLTSSSLMVQILRTIQPKTDTTGAAQDRVFAKPSKKECRESTGASGDIIQGPQSRSNSRREDPRRRRSSSGQSKKDYSKREAHHVKQRSDASKSSNGKYDYRHIINWMEKYNRRMCDTNATVEPDTSGEKVIHRLSAIAQIRNCKKHLPVIHPVQNGFPEALDYRT